jgi:hypothetical protein
VGGEAGAGGSGGSGQAGAGAGGSGGSGQAGAGAGGSGGSGQAGAGAGGQGGSAPAVNASGVDLEGGCLCSEARGTAAPSSWSLGGLALALGAFFRRRKARLARTRGREGEGPEPGGPPAPGWVLAKRRQASFPLGAGGGKASGRCRTAILPSTPASIGPCP